MAEQAKGEMPEAVRKTLEAMTGHAVARCKSLGIALEDFYAALLDEQRLHPEISVAELFERTFRRLQAAAS